MTVEPIPVRVTRYACPCCSRTHSGKTAARRHIARCWWNPEARGCKTCKHFEPAEGGDFTTGYPGSDESCALGVSLAGHRECPGCGGYGWYSNNSGAELPCGPQVSDLHIGDGSAVKAGPIVHCGSWEEQDDER